MKNERDSRLKIAAIDFLNPAPLMWDFEHLPASEPLSARYRIDRMTPSECANRLATGEADYGLVPIAALATTPELRILPGCTIASKDRVRSLILVHRAGQSLSTLRTVAADTASRTTVTYARLLFHQWGNPGAAFLPMAANLDSMLEQADAAIVIGDPALMALEERFNRFERTGEELVYLDMAQEWRTQTGLPYISAVWAASAESPVSGQIVQDFLDSRDHGLANIEALAAEWCVRLPLPEDLIRIYLRSNIHYILDEECMEGMRGFFRIAAEYGVLPPYTVAVEELAVH